MSLVLREGPGTQWVSEDLLCQGLFGQPHVKRGRGDLFGKLWFPSHWLSSTPQARNHGWAMLQQGFQGGVGIVQFSPEGKAACREGSELLGTIIVGRKSQPCLPTSLAGICNNPALGKTNCSRTREGCICGQDAQQPLNRCLLPSLGTSLPSSASLAHSEEPTSSSHIPSVSTQPAFSKPPLQFLP